MLLFAIAIGYLACFGFLGYYIAGQKNRQTIEGFVLGLLFGPLGALIVALLPTLPETTLISPRRSSDTNSSEAMERRARQAAKRREAEIKAGRAGTA